ncbi:MAG: ThuA domain-containing protein [Phycisphaerae bacterium]|nr:ThuA domain-containing protein [Phycisphaerae bacterium]
MTARSSLSLATLTAVLLGSIGCSSLMVSPAQAAEGGKIKTLLLVGGSIHDWKNIGNVVEEVLKKSGKFDVTRVDNDLNALLPDRIKPFKLVVFYWTVGKITDAQRDGLTNHIAEGNGLVTFHSGADSFRDDDKYRKFIGGYFTTHPHYRTYQVSITEVKHPITEGIQEFMTTDEQYILNYDKDNITILGNGLWKGNLMPALWVKEIGKGRLFYNSGGHDPKAVEQPMFQKLLIRGCLWAAGCEVKDK